jgi:hypothetical protein
MCNFCGTNKYRQIYKNHYGQIPRESNGRVYEIHHIDGNHHNNDPSNLKAITLQEHYEIHYNQKDYNACYLMATQRMNKTPQEISRLASLAAKERIENNNWHFGKSNHAGVLANKLRIETDNHNFQKSDFQSMINYIRVKNGNHPAQLKVSCIYCREMTNKMNFGRRHGKKCKSYPKNRNE